MASLACFHLASLLIASHFHEDPGEGLENLEADFIVNFVKESGSIGAVFETLGHNEILFIRAAKEDVTSCQAALLTQAIAVALSIDALSKRSNHDIIAMGHIGRIDGNIGIDIDHPHTVAVDDVGVTLTFSLDLSILLSANTRFATFNSLLIGLTIILLITVATGHHQGRYQHG